MKGSISLGRIAGIQIGVHYSWFLILLLIAWSLAQGFFPATNPGSSTGTYWILGIVAAILMFASVLIHELAHSIVATARGMRVQGITLFIFGGVSNIETEPEKPNIEFQMAVVGPLTSIVLSVVFWGIGSVLGVNGNPFSLLTGIQREPTPIAALLVYLSSINFLLGVFNIIPGFPLDGGRVLRSIIWGATGNATRATNIAATVGRLFGWGLIAYGFYSLFYLGDLFGGIWIAFIGWFLSSAADSSRQEMSLQQHLTGVQVKEVMNPLPECIKPNTSVENVVRENFIQHGRRAVPVCQDDKLAGIVTLTDVKKIPQESWSGTPAQTIMTRSPLYTVQQKDDMNIAFKLLAQHGLNQVPVLDGERLVGLLSRSDVIRYLHLIQELGIKPRG